LGITLGFMLSIAGVWLGAALLIYGGFVHRRFGVAADLSNFPKPGLIAAALLGPGAAVGAHFVLPMPPAAAVLFSALTLNLPSVLLNALAIVLVASGFFGVSWLLNRRAALASKAPMRVGNA
jgi:hypothetical protein